MASYLQAENLSKSYGERVLFRNISFNINEGDKIALIAPNGTGKSSLLKILAGIDSSDRGGEVRFMRDIRVAFLDQHTDFDPARTLFDEVYSRMGEAGRVISEYERACAAEDRGRIERAMAAMDAGGWWNAEQRVRQVLSSLHLTRLDQRMGELSGGEAKRAAIASMLLQEADFLVMDEPTNHLDIDVIEFLEGYLQKSRCTLLMVTHDRYFLDRVCNTVFELDRGNLYTYRGNYSYFLEKRDERYRNMQADIDKSRNLLRRELEWIRSTPQARTGKARYRINAFYDLKQRASVSLARQQMSIDVATSRLGGKIIDCEDVTLHFGQRCMIDRFSYKFSRYERVGIVGKNGVGNYRQQGMEFRPGQTVFDIVHEIAETATAADGHTVSAMSMLNRFLFPPETHAKHVEVLSGGERRRLYLLTILMRNPNFLILDEPTNDLDIMTLNVLEDYLASFKGCLLIVSHDRYFLDKTVDHLFIMRDGGTVKDFVGTYSEYREYIREDEAAQARAARAAEDKARKAAETQKAAQQSAAAAPRRRLSYKEQRESDRIEAELQALEAEKAGIEARLGDGTLPHDELERLTTRIGEILERTDALETRWIELNDIS